MGFAMALADTLESYRQMRRSEFVEELISERKRSLYDLWWYIACDNPDDADERAAVDRIRHAVIAIPRFDQLRFYLAEDRWSGRYASRLTWGVSAVSGRPLTSVLDHEPVDGDAITDDEMTLSGKHSMIVSLFFLKTGKQGYRQAICGTTWLLDTAREWRYKVIREGGVNTLDEVDYWIGSLENSVRRIINDASTLAEDAIAQQDTLTDQLIAPMVAKLPAIPAIAVLI